jgi:hypothetical protein
VKDEKFYNFINFYSFFFSFVDGSRLLHLNAAIGGRTKIFSTFILSSPLRLRVVMVVVVVLWV